MNAQLLRADQESGARAQPLADRPLAMSLWLRLIKTYNLILRQARRAVSAECTLPQFDVMAQLARAEAGLTFRELSERLLVSAGNLTGIVDRLEKERLAYREVLPHDRRSFRIQLTQKGRSRAKQLIRQHARDIQEIVSVLPRKDRVRLRGLLLKANQRLEERSAGGNGRRKRSAHANR